MSSPCLPGECRGYGISTISFFGLSNRIPPNPYYSEDDLCNLLIVSLLLLPRCHQGVTMAMAVTCTFFAKVFVGFLVSISI